jgi:Arc/MetJ-type ribon-helix-helix transcriptional regulator
MSKPEPMDRFEMKAPPTWFRSVDDWRRKQDDFSSRAEAIRRLVEQALKATWWTSPSYPRRAAPLVVLQKATDEGTSVLQDELAEEMERRGRDF